MRKNKIIGNYIYNMMYQLINIIVPFITIPYIARVLGPNGTGIYDYTYSYAFVFTIICLFGMTNYGSKRIAYVRDSKEKMSNEFWSIWLIQLSVSIICLISYIFLKKEINLQEEFKKYTKKILVCLAISLIVSVISVFVDPILIKLWTSIK